jgi:UDP-N-acetylmuramoylalanine--D-glutamate ligase
MVWARYGSDVNEVRLDVAQLRGKKILIVGLGISGGSAARWLSAQGARVTVSELKTEPELDAALRREILELGVKLETGSHREEAFTASDMIVVSPGVPLDIAPLRAAMKAGIPIIGELELAGRLIETPVVAVTGTNGKSTTTALLSSMLQRAGSKVFTGGNIGTPFMDYAAGGQRADYVVLEVSSFQLDTAETFCPMIAILLNISPDHLDRYADYEAYTLSKLQILRNQGSGQYAILNDDDAVLSQHEPVGGVTILRYGREKGRNRQAFIVGRSIKARLPGGREYVFHLDTFKLPGKHNQENLLAMTLAGLILEVNPEIIQETIDQFQGLPDRLEYVGTVGRVAFYNDSKATNVDAAARSVGSFDRPVVLIAGGRHKGADYTPFVKSCAGKVTKAILLGEAKSLLADAFEGVIPISFAKDMKDAVSQSFLSAKPHDVVLLAPACSSFDMFLDFSHRGRIFREEVKRLQHGT